MSLGQEQALHNLLNTIQQTYGTGVEFTTSTFKGQTQVTATARDVVIVKADGGTTNPSAKSEDVFQALSLLHNVLKLNSPKLQPVYTPDPENVLPPLKPEPGPKLIL
jgi:hypothetical protein